MTQIKTTDDSGGAGGDPFVTSTEQGALVPIGPLYRLAGATPLPGLTARPYPPTGWAPESRALVVLADLLATDWQHRLTVPTPTPESGATEIKDLIDKSGQRQASIAEILSQHADPLGHWADLLSVSGALPRTWDVVVCAQTVGRVIATWFKAKNRRPRPAQIAPALMPPFPTPLTPSHPGGHATEAYLIAECLKLVDPALYPVALTLANRIADNRETAGLNYHSDTTDAAQLAKAIASLMATPTTMFHALLLEARKEWGL